MTNGLLVVVGVVIRSKAINMQTGWTRELCAKNGGKLSKTIICIHQFSNLAALPQRI